MAKKIPYYVSENYAAELRDFYQGSLARLEREVKLAYACKREEEESESFSIWLIESITKTPMYIRL